MKKFMKLALVFAALLGIIGCATVNQPSEPAYSGGYDFGAGDRYSPYPPYHHNSK